MPKMVSSAFNHHQSLACCILYIHQQEVDDSDSDYSNINVQDRKAIRHKISIRGNRRISLEIATPPANAQSVLFSSEQMPELPFFDNDTDMQQEPSQELQPRKL